MAIAGMHRNPAGSNRRTEFVARLFNSEHFLKLFSSSAVQESPQPAERPRVIHRMWKLAAFFSLLMRWTSRGRQRVEQHENGAARPAKRRRPF